MNGRLVHPNASLIDASTGKVLAGSDLRRRVDAVATAAAQLPPGIAFARMPLTVDAVVAFVGLFEARRPVVLVDPALSSSGLSDLVARYAPVAVLGFSAGDPMPEVDGYSRDHDDVLGPLLRRQASYGVVPHEQLGLLLTTSGSTGSPKLVRLSRDAVLANATSIATALALTADEVAVSSLPFFYSYGLSVLNSHLTVGARTVVTAHSLVEREFWRDVVHHGVTSLAAVPYQYEILKRLRFDPSRYPTLRVLTQAGGRLSPDIAADFAARMHAVRGRMYVMYGQTEATARMAILPAERVFDKAGSVGLAIPGGQFTIDAGQGPTTAPAVTGEILYTGPNVMLGYAEQADDVARGDDLRGTLATGDLGHLDDDGFLFVTGRLKRIAKVFGVRVNLDDVERMLRASGVVQGPVAAVSGDDRLVVFLEGADDVSGQMVARDLAERLSLHPTGFQVRALPQLPLLSSGKIDYHALEMSR